MKKLICFALLLSLSANVLAFDANPFAGWSGGFGWSNTERRIVSGMVNPKAVDWAMGIAIGLLAFAGTLGIGGIFGSIGAVAKQEADAHRYDATDPISAKRPNTKRFWGPGKGKISVAGSIKMGGVNVTSTGAHSYPQFTLRGF